MGGIITTPKNASTATSVSKSASKKLFQDKILRSETLHDLWKDCQGFKTRSALAK